MINPYYSERKIAPAIFAVTSHRNAVATGILAHFALLDAIIKQSPMPAQAAERVASKASFL